MLSLNFYKRLRYTFQKNILILDDEPRKWEITCIEIPECAGNGFTHAEAYSNAYSSFDRYINAALDSGKEIILPSFLTIQQQSAIESEKTFIESEKTFHIDGFNENIKLMQFDFDKDSDSNLSAETTSSISTTREGATLDVLAMLA